MNINQIAERVARRVMAGRIYWHGSKSPDIVQFSVDSMKFALLGPGVYLYKNKVSARQYGDYLYRVDVSGLKIAKKDFKFAASTVEGLMHNLGIDAGANKVMGIWSPVWWCTDGWDFYGKSRSEVAKLVSLMMMNNGWDGMLVDYPNGGEVCVVWQKILRLQPMLDK